MRMLDEARGGTKEESYEMLIDRSELLEVSFEYTVDKDPALLRGDLLLQFKPEEATGLGVLREWFFLLGSIKTVELCPNGKDIVVNSKNRKKYVNLLIQHRFVTSIASQITHFSQSFSHITTSSIKTSLFWSLYLKDLDKMHDGVELLFLSQIGKHIQITMDTKKSWFWKNLTKTEQQEIDEPQRDPWAMKGTMNRHPHLGSHQPKCDGPQSPSQAVIPLTSRGLVRRPDQVALSTK
uniref:HECT-type E3 ubiquitin transferase n=1 Tax=Solanum tuberosum TaxID=4113 RepID=M1DLF2_SOLTU